MALTIYNFIPQFFFSDDQTGIWEIQEMVISAIPFRTKKQGVPLEVVHNFRTDFPK